MNELQKSVKIAVAISRQYFRTKSDNRNAHRLRIPSNIRSNLVVLKMHETSLQHTDWNGLIQRFSEAGLITKWARSLAGSKGRFDDIQSEEGVINSKHFIGLGCCLWFGLTSGAIAAIPEQIIHYKMIQRNHHCYWVVADMLIDGRRHMFIFNGNNPNYHSYRA